SSVTIDFESILKDLTAGLANESFGLDNVILATDSGYTVVAQSGQNAINKDFGSQSSSGNISGQVFNDANANGVNDEETPQSGWTVFLDGSNGQPLNGSFD